jgi:uncharacterized membrane protein YdjX (TVP38/TMEM64 family)
MRRRRLLAGAGVVAAVAALGLARSPAWLLGRLAWVAADPLRLAAALVAAAVVRPLFVWPTTLLAVVAGYGYGFAGVPFALALVVVTSLPPYWLAERGRTEGRVRATGHRVVDETGDLRSVAASRLLPLPSDVVSVGAGIAGVAPGAFALGTAVGEVPWVVAGVAAGASLADLDRAPAALDAALTPQFVLAAVLLAVLALAGPLFRLLAGVHEE